MTRLYQRLGVAQPFDPAFKHVTSPIVSVPVLACLRFLLAFYTLFTLLFTLIWDSVKHNGGESYFSYFTHLSYVGLCAYFFAAGVQTLAFGRSLRLKPSYPLQTWPRPLQLLHVLLELTITTFPIVVTVVYWGLLASSSIFEETYTTWSNISVHLFNCVFALAEALFTDIPPAPWLALPFGLLLLAGYLGVAYITHETQHFYAYSFLDPQKQGALLAAYIAGIGVGFAVVFVAVRYIIVLRIWLVARSHARRSGGSSVGSEAIDDWEEVEIPLKDAPGVAA